MLKLNLTNKETSDIKFEVSSFPDGQQDIVLSNEIRNSFPLDRLDTVQILSRFNGFRDLELIIASVKALRRIDVRYISLYIPYLLGARSDRQFQEGGTSYLVDVVAPILNSLNLNSIEVLDVHSDVAAACINNLKVKSNVPYVELALAGIYGSTCGDYLSKFVLVSPDAGASKKIEKLANKIGYKGDIITCSKERALDGKLSKTVVPYTNDFNGKDLIIIDDICDGGKTFINIQEEIVKLSRFWNVKVPKIYLIVTHGIFSKGLKCLDVFDGIYTTNSIQDLGADNQDTYNPKLHNIKQLNVF